MWCLLYFCSCIIEGFSSVLLAIHSLCEKDSINSWWCQVGSGSSQSKYLMDYLLSCSFACVSIEYKSLPLRRMSWNMQTLFLYLKYNTAYCQQLYRANGVTSLIHNVVFVLNDLVPLKFWTLCTTSKKRFPLWKSNWYDVFPYKGVRRLSTQQVYP